MKRFGLGLKRVAAVLITITLLFVPIQIAAEDIVNDDCTINEAAFERNWRKYSDFDERIAPQARSWAVQQYDQIQEKIDELKYESFQLQTEMEFDRQIRLELRNVKKSLVNNLRANLVKSFFRLSFLTADAIKTGITLGQTYAKLFTAGALEALPEGLSYLKDAMDVVTGLTPDHGDSELAEAVKNNAGDLEDILKIADSPKNIASIAANRVKDKAEEKLGSLFPSVDDMKFSDEEVAILKDQNLRNRAIDDALMESYRINTERRNRITSDIPMEIQQLQINQARLEEQEKERVRDLLIAECKDRKEDEDHGPDEDESMESFEDELDVPGLSGQWVGVWKAVQVHEAADLSEEERNDAIGSSQNVTMVIGKTEDNQWTIYNIDDPENVYNLTVEGNSISYYYESTNPFDNMVYFEKMVGEIDRNETRITGTGEFGMPSTGVWYTYTIDFTKYPLP